MNVANHKGTSNPRSHRHHYTIAHRPHLPLTSVQFSVTAVEKSLRPAKMNRCVADAPALLLMKVDRKPINFVSSYRPVVSNSQGGDSGYIPRGARVEEPNAIFTFVVSRKHNTSSLFFGQLRQHLKP